MARCFGTRPVLRDQIFSRADEVIEHVLLVSLHARFVPRAAVLAAAAQIGHGIHAAHLEPAATAGEKPARARC